MIDEIKSIYRQPFGELALTEAYKMIYNSSNKKADHRFHLVYGTESFLFAIDFPSDFIACLPFAEAKKYPNAPQEEKQFIEMVRQYRIIIADTDQKPRRIEASNQMFCSILLGFDSLRKEAL